MKGVSKGLSLIFLVIIVLAFTSCKKSDTSTTSNATLSATVAGNAVTCSNVTLTSSNGLTILQGSNGRYTLTFVLKLSSAGIYTLGDQSTGNYITVTDNVSNISYSTDAANTGQATVTANGLRYNGTFYGTCNETSPAPGGGNVSVSNGSFTNM